MRFYEFVYKLKPNNPRQFLKQLLTIGLIAMVFFLILFMLGELALLLPLQIARAESNSSLRADYGYWVPMIIKPIDPQIIEELRRDNETIPNILVALGDYWPDPAGEPLMVLQPTPFSVVASPVVSELTNTPFAVVFAPTATQGQMLFPGPLVVVPTSTSTKPPGPPQPTSTPIPQPTNRPANTPLPTRTPTPTSTSTPTSTPSATPTSTNTSTATSTNTATSTQTATATSTDTPTPTNTNTQTATQTSTPTSTGTATNTATSTPTVVPPPPNINVGDPDNNPLDLGCGNEVVVDLSEQLWIDDLVFYEFYNPGGCGGGICLDWIIIEVSNWYSGPWTQVFYWGDTDDTNNGGVWEYHYLVSEVDNEVIPVSELHNGSGILVPVNDTYRFVRFYAPDPCGDPAQIDAIDTLP